MKHHYEYRINAPMPSEERISSFKDFDAVLKAHKESAEKPRSQNVIYWLALAGSVAASIFAWLFFFRQDPYQEYVKKETQYFASRDFIQPPLPSVEIPLTQYTMNADKGGLLKTKSGSTFKIPARALKTGQGQTVSGDVVIHYREMHDFVDFFLSGIPMTYDSAGKIWQFESAGMVEIFAEKNGQPLELDPEKPIEVELVTHLHVAANQEIPHFNIYKLDPAKRGWTYAGVENLQSVDGPMPATPSFAAPSSPALRTLEENQKRALSDLEKLYPLPPKPLEPQRANGSDFVFDFDFDKKDFLVDDGLDQNFKDLDFQQLKDALWQVHPSEEVSKEQLNQSWDRAKIRPLGGTDFMLSLFKNDQQLEVKVNPVLTGARYQLALEKYKLDYQTYSLQLEDHQKRVNAVNADFAAKKSRLLKENPAASPDADGLVAVKVTNRFSLNDFGIWNCDYPYLPSGALVEGSLQDDQNNKFLNQTAFLVQKDKNTVVRLLATDDTYLRYNDKSENLLWLVTETGQIAVFRPEDFKKIASADSDLEDVSFVMDVVNQPVGSPADVRRILTF